MRHLFPSIGAPTLPKGSRGTVPKTRGPDDRRHCAWDHECQKSEGANDAQRWWRLSRRRPRKMSLSKKPDRRPTRRRLRRNLVRGTAARAAGHVLHHCSRAGHHRLRLPAGVGSSRHTARAAAHTPTHPSTHRTHPSSRTHSRKQASK